MSGAGSGLGSGAGSNSGSLGFSRGTKPGRFALTAASWNKKPGAVHPFVIAHKVALLTNGPAVPVVVAPKEKISQLYRLVQGLPHYEGRDVISAVLGSQFSQVFDASAVDIRMVDKSTYQAKFIEGLHVLRSFLEFNAYYRNPEFLIQLAASCAARVVRGDADSHQGNFGFIVKKDGSQDFCSFDLDGSGVYQKDFSVSEIESPGFIEPYPGFLPGLDHGRPYNHFERSWSVIGGIKYFSQIRIYETTSLGVKANKRISDAS